MFTKHWTSQNFFQKPKRVFSNGINISEQSEIVIHDKFYVELKKNPSENSLLAVQFNLDHYIISMNPLLDISDTVFIYELDKTLKQFETSSAEFWEIKNRVSSEKSFTIDATILLISINSKFEESVDSIVPVKFKFES